MFNMKHLREMGSPFQKHGKKSILKALKLIESETLGLLTGIELSGIADEFYFDSPQFNVQFDEMLECLSRASRIAGNLHGEVEKLK